MSGVDRMRPGSGSRRRSQISSIGCSCTYLLAETQDLEALEVGQVLPSLTTVGLLGEVGVGPLAIDLVLSPKLLDGAGTGSTGKLGDGEGSQGGVGEGKNVTGHDLLLLTGGTVNQDLIDTSTSQ